MRDNNAPQQLSWDQLWQVIARRLVEIENKESSDGCGMKPGLSDEATDPALFTSTNKDSQA